MMRKTVYVRDVSEQFGRGWYIFKGLGILDFLPFFPQSKNTSIYQDVPVDSEGGLSMKLGTLKSIKKYRSRLGMNSGTDILLIADTDKPKILGFSLEEIRTLTKTDDNVMEGILLYCDIHDIDWNAVCYFRETSTAEMYMNHLRSQTDLRVSNDWNDFS
ncbi:MAG: hypothetical protein A2017_17520 [Lentisphaerae bacterium GWF2_44_16]|nr:MAG: hypothetical protein A2017_17520 [Lentisphaerae bacterium GWF2_44_16]